MRIILQTSNNVPIYRQIYDQIKEHILNDTMKEGDSLPSIRQLARDLKVSVITTTRAYTDLENDGYLVIIPGKGCYVKKIDQQLIEEKLLESIKLHFLEIQKCARILHQSNEDVLELLKTLQEVS